MYNSILTNNFLQIQILGVQLKNLSYSNLLIFQFEKSHLKLQLQYSFHQMNPLNQLVKHSM